MGKLEGKVAVVTGAAFGNGRGMAVRFAEEGADVAIADVDSERMEETAEMVRSRGRRALIQRCDVSDTSDVDRLFSASVAELGGVDVAVANAGVAETDTDCLQMTEAEWDRTISVNLKGTFFTLQAGARRMVEQNRGGRLIAITSIMSVWGSPSTPAYSASKGGVVQLVRTFAMAGGAHGITCNGIGPGFIDTGMTRWIRENPLIEGFLVDRTPAGRMGEPADVAHLAAYLASDEAGFVNGAIIFADGGITSGLYSGAVAAMMESDGSA
jgi:NAD(P)-dependent dehydrogenase (short-subunit alcohol dehydrogenase family)